jgi:hypothetical protein
MSVRVLQRLLQSVDVLADHFDRAAAAGIDPMVMPVPGRDRSDESGADAPPEAADATEPAPAGQDDPTTDPDHHSADDGVPVDNPNALLTTALTTWETTAV